ncbi:alpha/beta hydrolase [Vagococcus xieshaowenii]|uniref:Alpha/beta hydrolase n=1 Tax=Vagococcus xieshaowenii TaxID=2562451 RepID=A0AAJ5EEF7_9ENTE|nr:alpha/beta hydrolase [Vagococcus xieshaowenii]QCA27875.1 alpha/beta hydrolase [Vagococcus xieshaowenii]TFZ39446.1 alpha/beta hydrolase [Vagococcus xieshaowenii]
MKKVITIIISLLVLIVAGSALYLNMSTYSADPSVATMIKDNQDSVNVQEDKLAWVVTPTKKQVTTPAVIYYPGGLVKPDSYVPFAIALAKQGYPVYIAKMPLNLAVTNANKADDIINAYTLTDVVIGGHSLGGTMASRYANATPNKQLKGVFFLASYPDEKGELKTKDLPVLSIKGSQDGVLNLTNYENARDFLPSNTHYEVLEGGNHGQFGRYGEQDGDNDASLSADKQLELTSQLMIDWLQTL